MVEPTEVSDLWCSLCDILHNATLSRTHDDVDSCYFNDTCKENTINKLRDYAGDDW